MVVIRLARSGAKKSPFYHVVVTDKRNARDGRLIERVGYFDPMARGRATLLELNQERIDHWVKQGAIPSDRVSKLIKQFAKTDKTQPVTRPSANEVRNLQREESQKAAAKKLAAEKKAAEEAAKAEAEEAKKAEANAEEAKPEAEKSE